MLFNRESRNFKATKRKKMMFFNLGTKFQFSHLAVDFLESDSKEIKF